MFDIKVAIVVRNDLAWDSTSGSVSVQRSSMHISQLSFSYPEPA
ncbi:MAG TPA: hypothetical protein VJS90_02470 [Pseudomonas sp.]|nr:hypothetical protein [Pseudomonas sp.]